MNSMIDYERLSKAIDWFISYITWMDRKGKVDFYSGYMEKYEGYKRQIAINSHAALQLDKWNEDMVGTGNILDFVLDGMNAKDDKSFNNVIDFHSANQLKDKAQTNLRKAEGILFRLFKEDDEADAFDEACEFFGRWYPTFSYLLFMKDSTRFLPVKNSAENHYDRFRKLRINTSFLDSCSWENYSVFLQIHEEIQNVLIQSLDTKVTLLDAHSFVWTLWAAEDDLVFKYTDLIPTIRNGEGQKFIREAKERGEYARKSIETAQKLEEELQRIPDAGGEREAIVKVRVNQGIFRDRLLLRYKKCCLCGVSNEDLLIASHIKPWRDSEVDEKLDVDNGLLLCPDHDKLFDQGWISFDDDGKILITRQLDEVNRMYMNINPAIRFVPFDGNKKYLAYHRKHIFKGIE